MTGDEWTSWHDGEGLPLLVHLADDPGDVAWEMPVTKIEAFCGAQGFVFDDSSTVPPDFDFVFVPDPRNVCTCDPCLAAYTAWVGARTAETVS